MSAAFSSGTFLRTDGMEWDRLLHVLETEEVRTEFWCGGLEKENI